MNLKKIIETKYELFDKFGHENKQKSIDAVNYLAAVSAENRIPFEAMDVLSCIGTGRGNEILTSKNSINKRFFEYTKSFEADNSNGLSLDEIATININCDKIAKNLHEQKKKVVKDNIDSLVAQCQDLQFSMNNNFGALVRLRRELELVGAVDGTNYSKSFQSIHQSGFFKFHQVKDIGNNQAVVSFLTPEVVWELPNGRGKARFGQYRLDYNVGNGFVGIFSHKNNIKVQNRFHFPYEFYNKTPGAMCLGNFNSKLAECHKNGDIEGIFIILRALVEADGGGDVHIDPSFWNLDSTVQNPLSTMVIHVNPELKYLSHHCALTHFLPKNGGEVYRMHSILVGSSSVDWMKGNNFEHKYSRQAMLYLYKNFIEGKDGEPCQEWKDWAARNPEHRDVTHKE